MIRPPIRYDTLETARACASFGAHHRTVAMITGLSSTNLRTYVYAGQEKRPCGRPPHKDDVFFSAPIRIRAELTSFAQRYQLLRAEGFMASKALVETFRRTVDLHRGHPLFEFDHAFSLVSHLEGIWVASTPMLTLVPCRFCKKMQIAVAGAETEEESCPMCKIRSGDRNKIQHQPAPRSLLERPSECSTPQLDVHVRTARLLRTLQAAGAHDRIIDVLLADQAGAQAPRSFEATRTGRVTGFGRAAGLSMAVRFMRMSSAGILFRQLRAQGFQPVEALVATHQRLSTRYPKDPSDVNADLNRCFETIARLEGIWGAPAELTLVACQTCRASFIVLTNDARSDRRRRAPCCYCSHAKLLIEKPSKFTIDESAAEGVTGLTGDALPATPAASAGHDPSTRQAILPTAFREAKARPSNAALVAAGHRQLALID